MQILIYTVCTKLPRRAATTSMSRPCPAASPEADIYEEAVMMSQEAI